MSKNLKQIEGQLSIFDFCMDTSNFVAQSNELIRGRQSLSLNAAKLLRSAIMQIKPEDEELKPYVVTVSELAKLFNVSRQDIHKSIDNITDEIIQNPLYIKEEKKGRIRWIKSAWVKTCKYDSEKGVFITLNDELKPLLLNLKAQYTQYTLDSILCMKSIYGIRIFELILSKIMVKVIPKNGVDVIITLDEIRNACDCVEKLKRYSSFKEKVLIKALKEINEKTLYEVTFAEVKSGKSISAIIFHVNMSYH